MPTLNISILMAARNLEYVIFWVPGSLEGNYQLPINWVISEMSQCFISSHGQAGSDTFATDFVNSASWSKGKLSFPTYQMGWNDLNRE